MKIYVPDRSAGWRLSSWREMAGELIQSRGLVWRLFVRDFSARYKQTVLGVAWAVIMPVALVGTFFFLNRSGVFNIGEIEIPYPAYALLGLTVWQVFAGGLTALSNSIASGGGMVVKINFPKEALVLASSGQTAVDTGVRLLLLIAVFAYYRIVPPPGALLFPLALVPLILLTLGLGLLLSLLNALMRDVANIVTLATMFLLFLTPVLYPAPESGLFQSLTQYNPLAPLVASPRDLVMTGRISDPAGFVWASIFSAAVFLACWRLFHVAEPRIVERVGLR